jgi:hypothetical protein
MLEKSTKMEAQKNDSARRFTLVLLSYAHRNALQRTVPTEANTCAGAPSIQKEHVEAGTGRVSHARLERGIVRKRAPVGPINSDHGIRWIRESQNRDALFRTLRCQFVVGNLQIRQSERPRKNLAVSRSVLEFTRPARAESGIEQRQKALHISVSRLAYPRETVERLG